MYCSECGKMNADESRFCYACGARLSAMAQEAADAVPPENQTATGSGAAPGSQSVPLRSKNGMTALLPSVPS